MSEAIHSFGLWISAKFRLVHAGGPEWLVIAFISWTVSTVTSSIAASSSRTTMLRPWPSRRAGAPDNRWNCGKASTSSSAGKPRPPRPIEASAAQTRSKSEMMGAEREQQDDRQRNPNQPKYDRAHDLAS